MGTNNHLDDNGISLWVDAMRLGRVDRLPDELRAHVEECTSCKHEVFGLYRTLRDVPVGSVEAHPYFTREEQTHTGQRQWYYRIAVMLALTIGAGSLYFLAYRNTGVPVDSHLAQSPPSSVATPSPATTPPPAAENTYAENFVPSPNMEDLVGTTYRSESVKVLSPLNGIKARFPMAFRWQGDPGATYVLKLMNNREKEIIRVGVTEQKYTLRGPLLPGVYYWLLLAQGDIVHAGKFTVR